MFFMQVILLFCVLMGGCPENESKKPQEIGNWMEPSPTAVAEIATPTPTTVAEAATSVPTTPMEEATPSPTVIVDNAVTEKFDIEALGMVSYKGENGEEIYEASTCFYDDNGLLCVAMKAAYQAETETCILEKSYYLPNGTLYREEETLQGEESLRVFEGRIKEKTHVTKAYEPIIYEVITGYVWTPGGKIVKASELLGENYGDKFVCTDKDGYITVTAGEKIKVDYYFSWFSEVAGIVFLDGDDQVVSAYSFTSSTQVKDQYLLVPEGAEKMHLSMFVNQMYSVKREVLLVGANLEALTEEEYLMNAIEALSVEEKSGVVQYNLDKAYVTFVLDDCRPDMDQIADIFQEKDVPLCIAAVCENLRFPASEGKETRWEVCERVEASGGEILAHDGEVITEALLTDCNGLIKHFYEDKWMLKQMGFKVAGIILAGGTGQVVGHEMTDLWARAHFSYSDLYGEVQYGEPYYHRRFWLGNCLDTYQQVLQNAVEEKEWVVFYLHDLKEVNSAKLQEILQYLTSLSQEDVEIVTYKELYDKMW